ncbi:MAG: UbiD family decarboxylase [Thermoguttaceae bacterium]|nr:UbiD family decarboxylase [Thermoguttaceae bacterium]
MSLRRLGDFLAQLEQAGELARIEAEVLPSLEAAELVRRSASGGGQAMLFDSVRGACCPLLANLLGTETRVRLALGVQSLDETAARLDGLVHPEPPAGWFERLKTPPYLTAMEALLPRTVRTGPCQQVARLGNDVDLGRLPALTAAPDEPRPSITGAILFTTEPSTGRPVTGRYSLEVVDRARLAVCLADHDEPARLVKEYARRRQTMPVAFVLGGDPVLALAASMPSAPGADVCRLAALLREKPIDVVACRSVELEVPAEAEMVLEGQIEPSEPWVEAGPLATSAGFYRPAGPAPVVQLTAITERANPVVQAIVPGPPPNEESTMRRAMARVMLPVAKLAIPGLADYDLPPEGAARHVAVVAIEKAYAGQAHSAAQAAWGSYWLRFARVMVVVDAEVDVRDAGQIHRAIAANFDPGRDLIVAEGPPDPLDPAAAPGELGRRIALDATRKLPGERPGPLTLPAAMSDEMVRRVASRWPEYGLD